MNRRVLQVAATSSAFGLDCQRGCPIKCAKWLCKPGSVRLRVVIIPLGRWLPSGSSSLPGNRRGPRPMFPYLALLRMGFTLPPSVTRRSGALLPHHFTLTSMQANWRSIFCGTFLGFLPPDVIWHSALCSPDFPR